MQNRPKDLDEMVAEYKDRSEKRLKDLAEQAARSTDAGDRINAATHKFVEKENAERERLQLRTDIRIAEQNLDAAVNRGRVQGREADVESTQQYISRLKERLADLERKWGSA